MNVIKMLVAIFLKTTTSQNSDFQIYYNISSYKNKISGGGQNGNVNSKCKFPVAKEDEEENERKKILANFPTKFTSTNDIYVCVGTYFCKYEPAYPTYLQLPPIRSYVKTTYIDSNNYICRNYRNLEDERDFYVYRSEEAWEKHHHLFELSKHTWPTSEFEEKHMVLNPYNSHIEDNGFNEIRTEFFLDCMTMSQEESKQRLLKKHN